MNELDAVGVHIGFAADDSDLSMIQPMPLEDIQQLLSAAPDKQAALEYRRQHALALSSQEERPLCSTTSREFGEYSIGLELYMLFLKQMSWMFFIISLICILPLYTNYRGDYFEVADALDLNAALSIGNTEEGGDSDGTTYLIAWGSDVLYTGLFLLMLPIFLVYALDRVRRNRKSQIQYSDYAVQVKGISETITEDEIRTHFSDFGAIREVHLARKYNNLLFEYKTLASLRHELERRRTLLQAKQNKSRSRKTEKLSKKINKLQVALADKNKAQRRFDQLPVIRAYIVFEERVSKVRCLKFFQRCRCCACLLTNDPTNLARHHRQIKVSQAPEPSGIHFENLEVSKCSRRMRGFVTTLVILLLMAVSVYLVYEVKTADDDLPVCEDNDIYSMELEEFKELYGNEEDEVYCWCKNIDSEDLAVDSDLRDFCSDYITKRTRSMLLRFGSACGIVIVNLLLKFIIRKLIAWERHANISREQRKIMTRMFWAMFINTGLIVLVVNANFEDTPFNGSYLFEGKYSDFTREWYLKVGGLISIMAALAVVSPHGLMLFVRYPLGAMKRCCCWKRYKNQYDLNKAFLGRPFDMAARSAQILMLICVFFMYSGGMPVLNVMIFVALVFIYWAEKVLLLRDYAIPPHFSVEFYVSSLKTLYVAIAIHCAFSLYMMGSPDIFPPSDEDETEFDIIYRASSDSGLVYIALIAAVLVMYIFAWLITNTCIWCLKKMHMGIKEQNTVPLTDAIEELRNRGLVTYDISELEHYRRLINEMNLVVAADKAGVLSNRRDRVKKKQSFSQDDDATPRPQGDRTQREEGFRARLEHNEEDEAKPRLRDDNISVSSSDFEKGESITANIYDISGSNSDSSS